jgi:hypothetical protein
LLRFISRLYRNDVSNSLPALRDLVDLLRMRQPASHSEFARRVMQAESVGFGNLQARAVCAVFEADDRGGAEVIASAVLFGIGSALFAISAAHVFLRFRKSRLWLAAPGGSSIPLADVAYTFTGGFAEPDTYDNAFIRLSAQQVLELDAREHVPIGDVDMLERAAYERPLGSMYYVVGYPCRVQRKGEPANSVLMKTLPAPPDRYDRLGLSEITHIVLKWNRKSVQSLKGPMTGWKLHGMSGGGIWTAPRASQPPNPRQRFLGVLTEYHEGSLKTIVGTRIGNIVTGILDKFPELEGELERSSQHPRRTERPRAAGSAITLSAGEPRPLCEFIGSALMSVPGTVAFVILLRLTNEGTPTILRRWKAEALLLGSRYQLSVELVPPYGPPLPVPGLKGPLQPGMSIVEQTLSKPLGAAAVSGYILATTKELTVAQISKVPVQHQLSCEDASGIRWTFRSPSDDPDKRDHSEVMWP